MIAYKGFDKDLSCTSYGNKFQYRLNEWNEEPEANCVKNGFHCAENPLDCLSYYHNWDESVFYMVEAAGDIDEDGRDSKISCTRMRLIRQLDMKDFVYQSVLYIYAHPDRGRTGNPAKTEEAFKYSDRFVIVRGTDPEIVANKGVIIGAVQENNQKVLRAAVIESEGPEYLYRFIDGKITRCSYEGK